MTEWNEPDQGDAASEAGLGGRGPRRLAKRPAYPNLVDRKPEYKS